LRILKIIFNLKKKNYFYFSRSNLKEEGIYIFGGRLGSGEASNTTHILKLGSEPYKVITPNVKNK
jgi:hypothetical protein